MARSFRSIACAALFAVTVCGVAGDAQSAEQDPQQRDQQPPPSDQQPPIFRAGINFVRVDVIATDKSGGAVWDLQPGDFEIAEEGKLQKIETFRFIELDGGLTQDAPPRAI